MRERIELEKCDWVFITPIVGLEISKDIGGEFTVKNVTFIDRDRLRKKWKKFGIQDFLSQIKLPVGKEAFRKYLLEARTFAVIIRKGNARTAERECLKVIDEEAAILSLSYLGYGRRQTSRVIGVKGKYAIGGADYLIFSKESKNGYIKSNQAATANPMVLDINWQKKHRRDYYFKLLRILNGGINVTNNWRRNIEKAAILVGKSICSRDLSAAFMCNMIALEVLLTSKNDRVIDALPERCEAFLGWMYGDQTTQFMQQIKNIYQERCKLVHEGDASGISKAMLVFTDELIYNLISNIVRNIRRFNNKAAVINFSKLLDAERLLDIKPRVRPKTLHYVSFSSGYTEEELNEI